MEKVVEALKKYKSFLVSSHVNLEGDSLGSQLAMKELLVSLGKDAVIVDDDNVPEHYRFLARTGEVLKAGAKIKDFDAALILDCPTLKRIGSVIKYISGSKPVINIDHHISNENFGAVNWVDPKASSAGEMIYRLFKAFKKPIGKETASALYVAILTDTGSFNYDNTSSMTHRIVSELLEYGLEPTAISENIYERRTFADIKLLGMVLSSLKRTASGDVAYLELTKKMLDDTGADISKSEGYANFAKSVDGVKVAILFREDPKDPAKVNVSFRSKGNVDVNKIASYFGGGGHMKASGCVLEGSLEEAERKVLAKVEETLK